MQEEGDIIDSYLMDMRIPRDMSVPLEVYIAFPETLTNEGVRERVRKQWLYGNDRQVVAMDLMYKDEISAICRPIGLIIDWRNYVLSIVMPSGLQIIIPNHMLNNFGDTTEERVQNLNDYVFLKFEKQKEALVADECIPLRGTVSMDISEKIINESKYTPFELLIMGLGYEPKLEIKRLYIPRILTWFRGFDGKPMHICQFTLPETGKTSFGIRNETLFNWKYIPEPPTLARLVLDARSGMLGEVFLRNGLVFDEFDKWTVESEERRRTFDAILTGMEQGKWERGVSALGVRVPDIPRLIPIVYFGNLGDFEKVYGMTVYNSRAMFNSIYSARLTHDVRALCDRLSIVDACFKQIRIMDYLSHKVLPDSILRGIIQHMQNKVKSCEVSELRGRLGRHGNNTYAILKAVLKDIEPSTVDRMVSGSYDFDKEMLNKKDVSFIPKRD